MQNADHVVNTAKYQQLCEKVQYNIDHMCFLPLQVYEQPFILEADCLPYSLIQMPPLNKDPPLFLP